MQFRRDMVTGFLDQDFLKETKDKVSKTSHPSAEGMQNGRMDAASQAVSGSEEKSGFAGTSDNKGDTAGSQGSRRSARTEAALAAFRELAGLVVPADAGQAVPVLQLRFDGIDTHTTLSADGDRLNLRIDVTLPNFQVELLPALRQFVEFPEAQGGWNRMLRKADGSQVVVRTLPLASPLDERIVLNAVMDTANEVAAWHDSVSSQRFNKRR